MPLLTVTHLSKAFGSRSLFKNLTFSIEPGDKIGVVGPNGVGKSTLLKILNGTVSSDAGSVVKQRGVQLGFVPQASDFKEPKTLLEVLGVCGDVQKETESSILLGKAQFENREQLAHKLSGGWKKRLAIVSALVGKPDVLLLDEPTNHLDISGILWLEKFLLQECPTFFLVSHDRAFLEAVCTTIYEINPCYPQYLLQVKGSYSQFLLQKEAFLLAQKKEEAALLGKVREEMEWLRASPKARTTKSRSRIKRAYELIGSLHQVKERNQQKQVAFDFSSSQRETKKLISVKNLTQNSLFKGVSFILSPGDRLGVVGENGTGKTTLLKLLAKHQDPQGGTVKWAEGLKVLYFDQMREKLDENQTLKEALSPNGETVVYQGKSQHVHGFAKRFLFSDEMLLMPIKYLSGGERARIHIAKMMLEPADVLLLDEPTNDLDIPTLEVLEESLLQFPGAVVLITHDRSLLDRVTNVLLGLGKNNENQLFSDCEQWIDSLQLVEKSAKPKKTRVKSGPSNKLSYKEKRELEAMIGKIEEVEEKIKVLETSIAQGEVAQEIFVELASLQQELEGLFLRWEELSCKE